MKKIILVFIFSACMGLTAVAQLSTGTATRDTFRLGNRAEMGDFGLYIGAQTSIFKALFEDVDLGGTLPLLNFKYMVDDNLELRVGLELYRSSRLLKGSWEEEGSDYGFKNKKVDARNFIYPGAAYHFSDKNLLDVYVGAELPIGVSNDKTVGEATFGSDKAYKISSKSSFHVGLGVFAGLQTYVAVFPVAIGVEYGIAYMSDWGMKYKIEEKLPGQKATVSYKHDPDTFSNINVTHFDSLTARQTKLGSQIRFTVTYFFKN